MFTFTSALRWTFPARRAAAAEIAIGDSAGGSSPAEHERGSLDRTQLNEPTLDLVRDASARTLSLASSAQPVRSGPESSREPPAPSSCPAPGAGIDDLVRRLSQHVPPQSRYKHEGEIARGGMGAILKVWDEDLRRHLAMKVALRADNAADGATPDGNCAATVDGVDMARFLEEAQVTSQLDHPGIVPVHELGLDADGCVYFTMKLVQGRDLRQIFDMVRAGTEGWNQTRALSVILRVCEAMLYAHAKGVIHRDLKPGNVMVGNFGEVYVMDWGLARVMGRSDTHDIRIDHQFSASFRSIKTERREERERSPDSPIVTMDGRVIGTPAYMPPEQARGDIELITARSDVYAIGAMLYNLLAGEVPFVPKGTRVSPRTLLARVLEGPPRPLRKLAPDVPPELVAICEKAMAREPEDRYESMLALARDLRAYLEHRVVKAHATGAWAEACKWVERNKPLATALAGAVVLLIAGLTASLVFKVRADDRAAELLAANTTILSKNAELEAKNVALDAAKKTAQDNETLATQTANDVLRLSAILELEGLVERVDALRPALPSKLEEYDRWLADARVLFECRAADPARGIAAHSSLQDHEAKLAEIPPRAQSLTPE